MRVTVACAAFGIALLAGPAPAVADIRLACQIAAHDENGNRAPAIPFTVSHSGAEKGELLFAGGPLDKVSLPAQLTRTPGLDPEIVIEAAGKARLPLPLKADIKSCYDSEGGSEVFTKLGKIEDRINVVAAFYCQRKAPLTPDPQPADVTAEIGIGPTGGVAMLLNAVYEGLSGADARMYRAYYPLPECSVLPQE